MYHHDLLRASFLALVGCACYAQATLTQRFEGRVITSRPADRLVVEVHGSGGRTVEDRTYASRDGYFSFQAESGKLYEFRVLTDGGERLMSDYQSLRQGQFLELRVPGQAQREQSAPGGGISALRLAHKPPKPALRLFKKANSLAEDGDVQTAAEKLEEVVKADPNWFEAWANLGVRRLSLGKHAEAADAFRKAIEIDPNAAGVHSNLALALLFLKQPTQAEDFGRRALLLDPDHARAAYVLALALLQQNRNAEEAMTLMRQAVKTIPRVHLSIAEWYCRNNKQSECAEEIRAFLKTPAGPQHEQARKWLTTLDRNALLH